MKRSLSSEIDNDLMSDISTAVIQQIAPKLVDQVQSLLPQIQQLVDQTETNAGQGHEAHIRLGRADTAPLSV